MLVAGEAQAPIFLQSLNQGEVKGKVMSPSRSNLSVLK